MLLQALLAAVQMQGMQAGKQHLGKAAVA